MNLRREIAQTDLPKVKELLTLAFGDGEYQSVERLGSMTNHSYKVVRHDGQAYFLRIPGEGSSQLVNRRQEAAVYKAISGKGLCDDLIYIDPDSGYKVTKFLSETRVCNPSDERDLKRCMEMLKTFHGMKLKVNHTFDLFEKIEFYESLRDGAPSIYEDYGLTKEHVLSLKPYIDQHSTEKCLTHIDAVSDNFVFYDRGHGEELQLVDWEYAGMQDPHVDIAMFCIYSLYDREQVERLISLYFDGACPTETRIKIYCYIAVCGLLWSNWCEYKHVFGIDYGEYSLRQYLYAKDYYKIAIKEMERPETA